MRRFLVGAALALGCGSESSDTSPGRDGDTLFGATHLGRCAVAGDEIPIQRQAGYPVLVTCPDSYYGRCSTGYGVLVELDGRLTATCVSPADLYLLWLPLE